MRKSELLKILKSKGCMLVHEGTKHEVWYSPLTGKEFLVWRHVGKEIPTGTLNKIMKDAGIK